MKKRSNLTFLSRVKSVQKRIMKMIVLIQINLIRVMLEPKRKLIWLLENLRNKMGIIWGIRWNLDKLLSSEEFSFLLVRFVLMAKVVFPTAKIKLEYIPVETLWNTTQLKENHFRHHKLSETTKINPSVKSV